MKIRLTIRRQLEIQPDEFKNKVDIYLKNNYYRILEEGPGYVIFIDDEYSDRKRRRSDYHSRIGEGKLEFYAKDNGTDAKLIFKTPVLYPIFLMMLFAIFGIYNRLMMPVFFSTAFLLPVFYKIYYLKENVFSDLLAC